MQAKGLQDQQTAANIRVTQSEAIPGALLLDKVVNLWAKSSQSNYCGVKLSPVRASQAALKSA